MSALRSAALCADEHREAVFSDNFWVRSEAAQAKREGRRQADAFSSLNRGPKERDRQVKIQQSIQHTVFHLARALDLSAAAAALVLALNEGSIMYMDWNALAKAASKAAGQSKPTGPQQAINMKLQLPGEPGRGLQQSVLDLVSAAYDSEPHDWLPWLLKYRNSRTHRPESISWWATLEGPRKQLDGLITPLPSQPDWAELRALLETTDDPHGLAALRILKPTEVQLDGLLDSTMKLVTSITRELTSVWVARRKNPTLLIQHGGNWPKINEGAPLKFSGYGPDAQIGNPDLIMLGPDLGRRMKAARLFDDSKPWREE